MNEAQTTRVLPRYQCHKKVWALKIREIHLGSSGDLVIGPANEAYPWFTVPAKFVPQHNAARPQVGWYWVRYEDGYESFSPADAFESGYTRIND